MRYTIADKTRGERRGERGEGIARCLPSSAFTLIEMLIVVSIMMILVAAGASVFRPASESRRTREAARAINVYLSSARSHAMETGRPCGVMFERNKNAAGAVTSSSVLTLQQCEVTPNYAGMSFDATVLVQDWTYDAAGALYWAGDGSNILKVLVKDNTFPPNMIHRGDRVRVGNSEYMTIVDDPLDDGSSPTDFPLAGAGAADPSSINFNPADKTKDGVWINNHWLTLRSAPPTLQSLWKPGVVASPPVLTDWSGNPGGVTFTIQRAPVKSAVSPLQLPAGSAVDLDWSGTNTRTLPYALEARPFVIMFAPDGSVDEIRTFWPTSYPTASGPVGLLEYGGSAVAEPIFMLVGRRERVPPLHANYDPNGNPNIWTLRAGGWYDPNDPSTWIPAGWYSATDQATWPNWQDLNNLWVIVNPQTGMITTGEMAAMPPTWNSATNYFGGDVVSLGSNFYCCVRANSNQSPPNVAYWNPIPGFVAARMLAQDAQSMGGK